MGKPWLRSQNRSWYVTIRGKKVNLGPDKAAAFKKWHELKASGREATDISLKDAVDFYLGSLGGCSAETRDVASRHLDGFLAHAGNLKCSKLRPHHWASYAETKEWAPSTLRTAIAKIRACLNYCVEMGKLDEHRFKIPKRDMPRYERRTDPATPEEQAAIEAAASPHFRDFLRALRLSGMRPGEAASARIEHFKPEESILLVRNKTARSTGEVYRSVYLSAELKAHTLRCIGDRAEGLIWPNAHGRPWIRSTYDAMLRRLCDKIGLRRGITLYGYRGRYVTSALEKGIDAISVSELVGHRSLDMVKMHYASLGKEHLRKAAEAAQ